MRCSMYEFRRWATDREWERKYLCRWHIQYTAAHLCNSYHNPLSHSEWEYANMKNVSRTRKRTERKSFTQFAQLIPMFRPKERSKCSHICMCMTIMGINFQLNYPLAIWKLIAQITWMSIHLIRFSRNVNSVHGKKWFGFGQKQSTIQKYEFEFSLHGNRILTKFKINHPCSQHQSTAFIAGSFPPFSIPSKNDRWKCLIKQLKPVKF